MRKCMFLQYPKITGLLAIAIFASILSFSGNRMQAEAAWVENSFEDFRDGAFLDGGSNLYVSKSGRLQMIHRWDLNEDGFPDIVVPSGHGHTEKENIYIYANSGGEIDSRSRLEIPGYGTRDGFITDIDKDGFNDLVTANYSDSHYYQMAIWIYFGSEEGFSPQRRTALPGYRGTSVAGGDFNGDGWMDLAVACNWQPKTKEGTPSPPRSMIYWNSPQGFHKDRHTALFFGQGIARGMASGDLDGDQASDLVTTGTTATYIYYSSRGAFSDTDARQALPLKGHAAAIGDVNADGHADLAICAENQVELFLGQGDGSFPDSSIVLSVEMPRDVVMVDINSDGLDDIVTANYATIGGATWTDSLVFISDGKDFSNGKIFQLPTLGASGVSAGDLNDDGFPEIVFSNRHVTNELSLLSYVYWNDKGSFRFGDHSQFPTRGSYGNTIGDTDHDGRPEVIFFNGEGGFRDGASQTHIYWGDGTRNYSLERRTEFPSHHISGHAHADFDDDGYVDLVWCNSRFIAWVDHEQNGLVFQWGSENGFQGPTNLTMGSGYGGVGIADINKDGYLDLLAGGVAPDLENPDRHGFPIYWGSAKGFQHRNRTIIPYHVPIIRAPLLMDFNRDGWLDIAGQLDRGTVTFWWGGSEGFDPGRSQLLALESQDVLMFIKGADFNKDGWLDLFLPLRRNPQNYENTSYIYYGSSAGYSSENFVQIPAYVPFQNTIADFDKDGWLDLFLTSYGGEVTGTKPALLYWGSENGFGQRPRTELPSNGSSGTEGVDYDGDGWLDIFMANHRSSGSIDKPVPYIHSTVSMLYWGGPQGYSPTDRLLLPNTGPSGLSLRDLGNSYDRGLYEDYLSSTHTVADGLLPAGLTWKADTPHGSAVKFQLRSADLPAELADAPWRGPDGPGTWYQKSGANIEHFKGKLLQYKARLTTPNGAATPYLTEVKIDFE